MLVVEGSRAKLKKIEELISKQLVDNKFSQVLLIDTVGVNYTGVESLTQLKLPLDTIWATNFINEQVGKLRKYDLIIFYTNDEKRMLDSYKQLEKLIGVSCIVTIQNNDFNELKVYDWKKSMDKRFLLTYDFEANLGGRLKNYEWFETEEEMEVYISWEMGSSSRVLEKLEIIQARDI